MIVTSCGWHGDGGDALEHPHQSVGGGDACGAEGVRQQYRHQEEPTAEAEAVRT